MSYFFLLGAAIYAIVGGPSAGKSSIIKELQKEGEEAYGEVATTLILDRLEKGVAEPWSKSDFQREVLDLQLRQEEAAKKLPIDSVFVDRGILDGIVYLKHREKTDTKEYEYVTSTIAKSYPRTRYKAVFFIEPHSANFEATPSKHRGEGTEEALVLAKGFKEIYSRYYDLIIVPGGMTPKQRASFIKEKVKSL